MLKPALMLTVFALPFTFGAATVSASVSPAEHEAGEDTSVGDDRLHVDTDLDVTDSDDLVVDVSLTSQDEDADRFGVRSRNTLEDLAELDTDTRAVSQDEHEGFSGRALLDLDDLDDIDSDLDVVVIDNDESESPADEVMASEDSPSDRQTFEEDAQFVFGG
jgi:hypothetical protein